MRVEQSIRFSPLVAEQHQGPPAGCSGRGLPRARHWRSCTRARPPQGTGAPLGSDKWRRRRTHASAAEPRNTTIDTWLDGLKLGWPEDDVDRPFLRRSRHPHVGHRRRPLPELPVEVEVLLEPPSGQEVAPEVLHARLDLLLRLVGPAQHRVEAPEVRQQRLERPVLPPLRPLAPPRPSAAGRGHPLRVAVEVGARQLVRVEQVAERPAQTPPVEAPPREAEGQHEDVTRPASTYTATAGARVIRPSARHPRAERR